MPEPKTEDVRVVPTVSFVSTCGVICECVYDAESQKTAFVIYDKGHVRVAQRFKDGSTLYVPYKAHNALLTSKTVRLAREATEYESGTALITEIQQFIKRYVALPDAFLTIATYYVLLSWIYDAYNEIPYLRVKGDFGSGKTRFLSVVGALCFKSISASGASTVAPIFHMLDKVGGTLVLDEADFRFSDERADIVKILNNGFQRGFPVLRCEKINQREFAPKAYTVYSPKLIASRENYDDAALESRCITLEMSDAPSSRELPHTLPESFEKEANAIRSKLLLWRLRMLAHAPKAVSVEKLHGRSLQIYAPLLALVRDDEARMKIIAWARESLRQAQVDRGQTTAAQVLEIILKRQRQKKKLSISGITEDFIHSYGAHYERLVTPKWIGGVIRTKLSLKTAKTNGVYLIADGQGKKLTSLCERFDVGQEKTFKP